MRKLTVTAISTCLTVLIITVFPRLGDAATIYGFDNNVATGPPVITAIAPTSGTIGTIVRITGKYFGPTQGTSSVSFNGTAATSCTSWTDTSIKCVAPSGATSGNVTVTTPIGTSNGKPFTLMPPHITAIAPNTGTIGTIVTITGKYFGPTQGASGVSFNGTAATSCTPWTDTSIKCEAPSGATSGNVTVTTPIGTSNGKPFTLKPPPITAITPASGTIGTIVTITGKYFGPTQGASGVSFNGTAATSCTPWTDTSIKCVVPSGATSGNVTVTTPIGTSNGKPFTLKPPVITAIAPTTGTIGITIVRIMGKYFGPTQGTSSVSFNDTAASCTSWTDTSIKCVVPSVVPSGSGTGKVTVTVTTPVETSNGKLFTLKKLAVTTTSLPRGTVGTDYSQTLAASGGTPPYTWTITAGALPPGLLLNPATGVISGTPTTTGTSNFKVMVGDSATPAGTATQSLSITVTELAVTTTSLPRGTVGTDYSQTLTASGGTPPYTWTITVGALPAGLSLNKATGVISGIPATSGTWNFTVKVTDSANPAVTATQALSITTELVVTTASLPGGTVGTAYSQTLAASGGTPPYTWMITAGALPAGLFLNAATGVISGTPTTLGTSNFTVMVSDSAKPTGTATQALSITTELVVATASLPGGTVGTAYSQTLAASGGTPPYTWMITVGALPAGLFLNAATGVISGTPTTLGTSNFTVMVSDSAKPAGTATQALSITTELVVAMASLPGGTVGTAYSQTLAASGGTPPYTWMITVGALPAGLFLNAATGVISGTPTTLGTSNFTVMVSDSANPAGTATQALSITTELAVTTTSLPGGTVLSAYNQTLAASGGIPPYTWSFTGGFPLGLGLDPETGVITGFLDATGTWNFTVKVTDSSNPAGTATQVLSIIVSP